MTQFLPAGEGSILIFKRTPSPPLHHTIAGPGLEYISGVGRAMNVTGWFGAKFVRERDVSYRGQRKELVRPHKHLLVLASSMG